MLESIKMESSVSGTIAQPACFCPVFRMFQQNKLLFNWFSEFKYFGVGCSKGVVMPDKPVSTADAARNFENFSEWGAIRLGMVSLLCLIVL